MKIKPDTQERVALWISQDRELFIDALADDENWAPTFRHGTFKGERYSFIGYCSRTGAEALIQDGFEPADYLVPRS